MKLVNIYKGHSVRLGLVTERGIINVRQAAQANERRCPVTMEQVLAQGEEGLRELAQLAVGEDAPLFAEEKMRYAPVVTAPQKILCVGLNYHDHTAEIQRETPQAPVLFSKFNTALAAHRQEIPLPDIAEKYDYEAELVVIIGKEARRVSETEALDYVLGYTIGNDLTARELQALSGQWLLGKSLDSFAPTGPYLVTADEIEPQNLLLSLELNGELRQQAHTSEMIFSCAEIISYASRYFTLKPGDLIFTGTPGGVIMGYPAEKRVWLKPGDRITIRIEKLGELENTISR